MLSDYEGVSDGPREREILCSDEDCEQLGIVNNPYTRHFSPLCFHHAFVAALAEDGQARRLALGFAVAEGLRTPANVRTS